MRSCKMCNKHDLTDNDFYKHRKQVCRKCCYQAQKHLNRNWTELYNNCPEYRIYAQVKDLFKKACLRIREHELGLKENLNPSDMRLKEILSKKFEPGMSWARYLIYWRATYPTLTKLVREGKTKSELLNPENLVPKVVKKPN